MNEGEFLGRVGLEALRPWQRRLWEDAQCRDRLIRIPTGMGKTLGVLLTWVWHRVVRRDPAWPRRLVWCLPMRVLVEQTHQEVSRVLERLGLRWEPGTARQGKVGVHLLMGGVDAEDWHLFPEEDAVLVGTQDMLLSRALNRGYASGRARWPMEFGLLNQDALWVMDEVQLMDVGLATSAQLQAFRLRWEDRPGTRPCRTWWMSATLQPAWLRSADTDALVKELGEPLVALSPERTGGIWDIRKDIRMEPVGEDKDGAKAAALIASLHEQRGGLTLSVHNTVEAATAVFRRLQKHYKAGGPDLRLVHSRFRPYERQRWSEAFLHKDAPLPEQGRIVVATQVVEAGVDISARTLVTDLAPWSSLVQRLGRCARFAPQERHRGGSGGQPGHGEVSGGLGGAAAAAGSGDGLCVVLDHGLGDGDEKKALPYSLEEILVAAGAVRRLVETQGEGGIAALERFEEGLAEAQREALYPYEPATLLLESEWRDLYDTTPDLSGADVDVSGFIRSGSDLDCLVFWRDIGKEGPSPDWQPMRQELCAVPVAQARKWLCENGRLKRDDKGKPRAFLWDYVDGAWDGRAEERQVVPGSVLLVDAAFGGYDPSEGWSPKAKPRKGQPSLDISSELVAVAPKGAAADRSESCEALSETAWQSIAAHCRQVASAVRLLAERVGCPALPQLEAAALAHDIGKVHPFFQGKIDQARAPSALQGQLAKAPDSAWRARDVYQANGETRKGLRHELASALALFEVVRLAKTSAHPVLAGPWSDLLGGPRGPGDPGDAAGQGASVEEREGQDAGKADGGDRALDVPHWLVPLLASREAFDLAVYLCAAHHGKVRCTVQSSPADQEYAAGAGRDLPVRGVLDGDRLPAVRSEEGVYFPEVTLHLDVTRMGLSPGYGPSWMERVEDLLAREGPHRLAFLEALLRAADIRVSAGLEGGMS